MTRPLDIRFHRGDSLKHRRFTRFGTALSDTLEHATVHVLWSDGSITRENPESVEPVSASKTQPAPAPSASTPLVAQPVPSEPRQTGLWGAR